MKRFILSLCAFLMTTGIISDEIASKSDIMGMLDKLKQEQRIPEYYAVAFMSYARNPQDTALLDASADGLKMLGALPRALKVTEQVLAREPGFEPAVKRKTELEAEIKRIGERMVQLEAELAVNPDKVENLVSLTAIHIGLKDLRQAREALNRARTVAPDHVLVNLMKGAFEERLDGATKQAILLSNDAVERYGSGNREEAMSLIQQALAMSVVSPFVYDHFATILIREKNIAGARAVLREEMHIRREPQQMLEIGNLSMALGEFNQAMEDYTALLDQFGEDPVAYFNMSVCLQYLGDEDKARTYREKALKMRPELTEEDRSALRIRGTVISLGGERQ